ncbi:MAG: hypothetical protein H7317_00270 [Pseudorhodobacter sp.]|nr:hypothetical protein [Pseudorhodobacter sp.]
MPEDKATVTLQGAQDLLAGLARLGALTADQATALRFGLAAGFDATKTPGELVSQIEARADGSVYVNNARLR